MNSYFISGVVDNSEFFNVRHQSEEPVATSSDIRLLEMAAAKIKGVPKESVVILFWRRFEDPPKPKPCAAADEEGA